MKNLFAFLTLTASIALAQTKPNILFLYTDDQSYEAVRSIGNIDIDTPNLDRLAASGSTFTHTYNMGAWHGAVCVASRTMLVTGRTVWRAKNLEKNLKAEVTAGNLWPQRMAKQGYDTYFSGKWHISADVTKAFHTVVNKRNGMPPAVDHGYNRPISGQPDPWSPFDHTNGGHWQGGKHWSEVLGDDSIAFIEKAAISEKPFFMYLAFNAPHDPRQSPKEYVDRYPIDRIPTPQNFLPEYPEKDAIGAGKDLRDEKLAPFPRDEYAVKVNRQEYYAIITHMDAQVGRILDALKKSGKAENTWIFFTSDHGLACGHHGLMGKQNMYDHSLRVPFIVSGPSVPQGKKIASPIHLQDVMATALDLAGADKSNIEFQSLLPLLQGEKSTMNAVYAAYMNSQRAVIENDWKLILYPKAKVVKLFNLKLDPQEKTNLSADPALMPKKQALFATFQALQKKYADELDLATAFPELVK